MADPTIQTFCCHHGNGTDMAVTIMQEFNTDAYNAVCIFSSCLGILGAVYQVRLIKCLFVCSKAVVDFAQARVLE